MPAPRFLILSDIHGNWEALQAVLESAADAYDRIICLGDLVGYGADPNAVTEWVRANVAIVVRGNHDRASAGLEDLEWFNPIARRAAEWTHAQLTPENLAYIAGLPKGPIAVENFQVMHGSPLDEDEYVVAPADAGQSFPYLETSLAFFGHTHLQGGFQWGLNRVRAIGRPSAKQKELPLQLEPDTAYLINPGSVGQPRDGDPRAGYVLYNLDELFLMYRRVPYDLAAAQAKIHRAGLPDLLAERLAVGR
ncbi:MAG TPA: metallophosphoesterase family protein [Bryobacteraceae bacterium]|nr:metallophosphoesterase family protein [Bryobacteraceae bacterium]